MALQVKNIESQIMYDNQLLPIIPGMSIEEMKKHYALQYPELITSLLTGPEINADGIAIYKAAKQELSSLG